MISQNDYISNNWETVQPITPNTCRERPRQPINSLLRPTSATMMPVRCKLNWRRRRRAKNVNATLLSFYFILFHTAAPKAHIIISQLNTRSFGPKAKNGTWKLFGLMREFAFGSAQRMLTVDPQILWGKKILSVEINSHSKTAPPVFIFLNICSHCIWFCMRGVSELKPSRFNPAARSRNVRSGFKWWTQPPFGNGPHRPKWLQLGSKKKNPLVSGTR